MKKVFLAVLAIAAMMVSCQKEGLVDNQKETPEVEVNEPQPVILGSNLFKAPTTKASVDNIGGWRKDMKNGEDIDKFIYVWALNSNSDAIYPVTDDTPNAISKVFIDNVGAILDGEDEEEGTLTGSLVLKDPNADEDDDEDNDPPFYYGVDDKDIYDFYAYYLGYSIDGTTTDAEYDDDGLITVSDVKVTGNNDIMIASTNKEDDAIVKENGTMVNPNYLYSQYSARHGVKPNLVFNHMLSKFTFYVRYAGNLPEDNQITLTGITFKNAVNLGTITLNGDTPGFVGADESTGDINMAVRDGINLPLVLTVATNASPDFGYQEAGNAMVVPAGQGSYTIDINFEQKFGNEVPERVESFKYENKVITPNDVVITDGTATSFEKGKQYRVYITVYGLEEVVVKVQLTEWDYVGDITFDPDQKEDGVYQYVVAKKDGDETTSYNLFVKEFSVGEMVYTDVLCTNHADEGTYTLDDASKERTEIATIKVKSDGTIDEITHDEAPQQEPED